MRRFTLAIFPDVRSALRSLFTLEELHRAGALWRDLGAGATLRTEAGHA